MATLQELQESLAAIKAARATGARRVDTATNGVREIVEFKSDNEMQRAIAAIEREIAAMQGVVRVSTFLPSFSKGF